MSRNGPDLRRAPNLEPNKQPEASEAHPMETDKSCELAVPLLDQSGQSIEEEAIDEVNQENSLQTNNTDLEIAPEIPKESFFEAKPPSVFDMLKRMTDGTERSSGYGR